MTSSGVVQAPTGALSNPDAPRNDLRRRWLGLVLAVVLLAVLFMASLAVGARQLDLATVWRSLGHDDGSDAAYIVNSLRLPRGILAILVGASLGLAGALMQAVTRNPLADPGLMGVEIGASTAVVIAIAFLGITAPAGYVWFAFAGAMIASVVVYVLGASGRAVTPERIVVAGAAVTAAFGAFVSAVLLLKGQAFDQFRFWVIGSLANRGFDILWELGPFMVVGAIVAIGLAPGLNVLALGEDTGRALGANATRIRLGAALAVTLLCGAATAAVGPIGFVGLTVPHVARMITGPDNSWVLPYSAVLAPILVLGADLVGRIVAAPGEVEVGIIMAFVGAPVFIALCRRTRIAQL